MDQDEQKAIEDVLSGFVEMFEVILVRNQPYISKVIAKMVPASDIDEITQQTFISAYEKLSTYNQSKPLRHWICRIAINKCNDFWRAQKRSIRKSQRLTDMIQVELITPDQSLDTSVHEILNLLSADDRLVMHCLYIEDMSIEAAAQYLGWGVSNVKIRSFRAKKRLKYLLKIRKWDDQ